jgi:hypothetical protein
LNKNILYLGLFIIGIFSIILYNIFYSENKESVKEHSQTIKEDIGIDLITLEYKQNKKQIQKIKDKNNIHLQRNIKDRQITQNNITIKGININNFNKFFNYENIDILLDGYINTNDKEMQNYIIKRFHEEIKNPKVVYKIIDMYNNTSDKKHKMRLSVLLSEINSDDKLNIYYKNINLNDKDMVSDFIASTNEINSENSTKKLLSLIDDIENKNFHIKGIKLIYSNSDHTKILSNIDTLVANNNFIFSLEQEKFILFILEKAPSKNALLFIDKYKYYFSNQEEIIKIEDNIKKLNTR